VDGRVQFVPYGLWSHRSAPHLSEVEEEELRTRHVEARQDLLLHLVGVLLHPALVSVERLAQTSIVRDVLT